MKFKGLTNIGKRHLAKIHANNGTLEFTKIRFGDGTLRANEDPLNLLQIKNFKMEQEILGAEATDNITSIETVIDNLNLTYGFHVREFGIFVKDGSSEILYYYMNDDIEASWMPPASDGPHKMEIKINMVMANATSVVVNTEDHDLYLTKSYFLKKLAEKMDNIIRKSGFNLDKTDEYNLDDTSKLATGKALKKLFDEIVRRIGSIQLTWTAITGKPNFSNSVSSSAENEFATPKAVKTAYDKGSEALNVANTKEPIIAKKSGFNLDKTDEYNLDDTTKLATGKALKNLFDEIDRRIESIKLTWTAITGNPNFSSSVNSSAENEFATPKAVKTAYDKGSEALNVANTKEPIIAKKSGFNLDKTDEYNLDDTTKLATGKALKKLFDEIVRRIGLINWSSLTGKPSTFPPSSHTHSWASLTGKPAFINVVDSTSTTDFATPRSVKLAYDKGVAALTEAQKKENAFAKNTAHNKNFGTTAGTVLEGNKIDQITGKTYGGILNTAGAKTAGKTYFDNNTKKLFLCKNNNSDTSANVNNYIALDNNSLLDRLENLNKREIIYNKITDTGNIVLSKPFNNYKKIIVEASNDELTTFTYTTLYTDEIVFNKNFTLMQVDGKFWYGKFTSYTNFNTTSENSVIHKIVGVNY